MSDTTRIAHDIKTQAQRLGFDACGFAVAQPVDAVAREQYRQWLAQGRQGCMAWAERYCDVRDNPQLLLDGARTVIMLAMNYYPGQMQPQQAPQFAYYAYGRDYHEVMRERMRELAQFIVAETGCDTRCCVDTAPLRERYWAQRAGLGFIGLNNQLILPGRGSYFCLGAVVTTLELPADEPCRLSCGECRACIAACPGHALGYDQPVDARRCLSCLTIEYRGELPQWARDVMGNRVYGCEECQRCCPHNRHAQPTAIADFRPTEEFLSLTAADIRHMTSAQFKRMFGHSAVQRTRLQGLQRNLPIRTGDGE